MQVLRLKFTILNLYLANAVNTPGNENSSMYSHQIQCKSFVSHASVQWVKISSKTITSA